MNNIDLINYIFLLFLLFQIKHFLCDFPLQSTSMVMGKGRPGWDFVPWLLAHSGVHGVGTLIIMLFLNPIYWWMGPVDFIIHFLVDRLKSGPKYLGRFNDVTSPSFWNVFGLDQKIHHLTHVAITYYIITNLKI